jgi:hypothetical protein
MNLYDLIPDLSCFSLQTKKDSKVYSLIKGAIQSGKSAVIHKLSKLFVDYQHNVVILVRNYTDDYEQMKKGLDNFFSADKPKIYFTGNFHRSKKDGTLSKHTDFCLDLPQQNCITISLAHYEHLSKLNECLDKHSGPLTVIIDEVDQLLYSNGLFAEQLDKLLVRAWNVIGVSATLYESIHDDRFCSANTFVLLPPPEYKGILQIKFKEIGKIDSKIKNDLFRRDKDLYSFLKKHRHRVVENQGHPFIALIKTERLIKNQGELLSKIIQHKKFKEAYTVLTYNGSSVTLYSKELLGKTINLPHKKCIYPCQENVFVFKKVSVQRVLQYLKDNGNSQLFPRILIIAHGLVGRGINIVSYDFGWHLTSMFYRPHSASSIPTLLQSIRLCGIYKDDISLTCHVEKKVYENIYKGYQLQEDIFQRLKKTQTDSLFDWILEEKFYKEKIPTKKLCKRVDFGGLVTTNKNEDTGMSVEDFMLDQKIESREMEHVEIKTEKLSKWVESNNLLGKMLRFLYDNVDGVSIDEFKQGIDYVKNEKSWMSNICNGAPGGKYSKELECPRLWYKSMEKIVLDQNIRKAMNTL